MMSRAAILIGMILAGVSTLPGATNYYVDASNGSHSFPYTNWATASTNIRAALVLAGTGDTVNVASATYNESITLNVGVTLLGGYPAGGGTRDPSANATTISSNAGNVVSLPANTTIDGFTIDGKSNAANCIKITGNTGVTIANNSISNATYGILGEVEWTSKLLIASNRISRCTYGMRFNWIRSSSTTIRNNLIYSNTYGIYFHDCFYLFGSSIINCTIYGNTYGIGANVHYTNPDLTLKNCIIWGNTNQLSSIDYSWTVTYCDIQGGYTYGTYILNQNPNFVDTIAFSLDVGTPCVNPGNGYTEMGWYGKEALVINGANPASYTTNATVILTIAGNAPTWSTNAALMKFSNDGVAYSAPVVFSSSNEWDITNSSYGGNTNRGFKTVYYQPLDASGNNIITHGATVTIGNRIEYITEKTVRNLDAAAMYYTIQDAINAAGTNNSIEVQSSKTYYENVNLAKAVRLRAEAGKTPAILAGNGVVVKTGANTTLNGFVIDGNSSAGHCIRVDGNPGVTIINNTICNSYWGILREGGTSNLQIESNRIARCTYGMRFNWINSTSTTIKNNLIYSNTYGIYFHDSLYAAGSNIVNCTLCGNSYGIGSNSGANNRNVALKNCIIWGNTTELFSINTNWAVTYNDIKGGYTEDANDHDNINTNPLFVSTASGSEDFHLKSKWGTLVGGTTWTRFPTNSPCIDAGDPASDYANEPAGGGGRINMGVYGNTKEASKSTPHGTLFIIK